jgi:DNA polymerase III epsilon subunit-like protein
MGKRLAFDIETNGFLETVDRLHCLVVRDLDTGDLVHSVRPGDPEALARAVHDLRTADLVVGHNIVAFDLPVLKKLGVLDAVQGRVRDTMLIARILFPDVKKQHDFDEYARIRRRNGGDKEHPVVKQYARIMGQHSLKAWGIRLGVHKGDYGNDEGEDIWAEWNEEMHHYCEQDVEVTVALWRFLDQEARSWYGPDWLEHLSIQILHRTAEVCQKITEAGWPFDEVKAADLYARLAQERQGLVDALVDGFGIWPERGDEKTPVRNEPKFFRTRDASYTQVKFVTFNPNSLDHVAKRLQEKYGWEPEEFTDSGKPKLDEGVLGHLTDVYPEIALLSRYLLVNKRIAALAEGKQAWLRVVRKGKIHASYMVNGTLSGRASHRNPNIAQVPATGVEFGHECRELFGVPPGWVMVGADTSGLELRCFAHYLAKYDGGAYVKVVTEGDIHTSNQTAAGLPTRNDAKTFIYAFLYGAGDRKIGTIVKPTERETAQVFAGKALKSKFLKRTPGLQRLIGGIRKKLETTRYMRGLDGRRLYIREKHAALNTLLQSAGAIICSAWMCRVELILQRDHGLRFGWDGDFVILGWIHDELQFAARNQEIAEFIGNIAKEAAQEIGDLFDFQCPLDGEFKIGKTWAETH